MLAPLLAVLAISTFVEASPILNSTSGASPSPLSTAQISAFKPYSYYAAAAYCSADNTLAWDCGISCNATRANFVPTFSGGDGSSVQFWYTGYDSVLDTVIVGHQGTHSEDPVPILTDASIVFADFDSNLFPGLTSKVGAQGHSGFVGQHAMTATDVLAAVTSTLARYNVTSVTTVGHSSGGAISLIEAVYLQFQLPSNIQISTIGYAVPRVGNQEFADYVDLHLPSLVTHINNQDDIVPILPGRFLGYHHTSGEIRIQEDGSWFSCPGQDNTSTKCSTGAVTSIFDGSASFHKGPYDGVMMSTSTCST